MKSDRANEEVVTAWRVETRKWQDKIAVEKKKERWRLAGWSNWESTEWMTSTDGPGRGAGGGGEEE